MVKTINKNKIYGVLHTENYFSFYGFCKKIQCDEIQKIDVYLDNQLIETINANKTLTQIEDTYNLDNFGFQYTLPEKYIGEKHTLYFKNHETQEDLQNSPYTLIDESNEKYNEIKFMYTLSQPIDEKRIKDQYCPNAIGFLGTDENLNDIEFTEFIKDLHQKLDYIELKIFYFTEDQKEKSSRLFDLKRVTLIPCNNIKTLINNIEIFISARCGYPDTLELEKIISKNKNVLVSIYAPTIVDLTLDDFENSIKNIYYPQRDEYIKLNLKQNYNGNVMMTNYKEIFKCTQKIELDKLTVKDYYVDICKYSLKSKLTKDTMIKAYRLYANHHY